MKNKLAAIRAEKGLTQKQLSDLSGVCSMQISHYESGRRIPSLKNALKIMRPLGLAAVFVEDVWELEDDDY